MCSGPGGGLKFSAWTSRWGQVFGTDAEGRQYFSAPESDTLKMTAPLCDIVHNYGNIPK